MAIKEKVAFIRGLMEGMNFDKTTDNGKVIAAVVELLDEMASEVEKLGEDVDTLADYSDELDHDLGELEEFVYSDDEEDDECECCGHHYPDDDDDWDDDEYYDDEDCDFDCEHCQNPCGCDDDEFCDCEDDEDDYDDDEDDDTDFIEVRCPNCGDSVFIDSTLSGRDIMCPNCNGIIKGEEE